MKIYGLLGNNINYSLSPFMHNVAFKSLNMDAEYRIFDRTEEELDTFFSELKEGLICGCNVTIPYKEKALIFVNKSDKLVELLGALNTISVRDGILAGYNTDYYGFLKALTGRGEGDLGFNPEGKSAILFGAGGAGKAVLFALADNGIKKIAISDLDTKRAELLAERASYSRREVLITVIKERRLCNESVANSDIIVNATPCGMKEGDPELFDYRYINERHFIFDLIYTKKTRLLKAGELSGAKAVGGRNMLLYQAGDAFEIWTGRAAPLDVMKKTLEEILGSENG